MEKIRELYKKYREQIAFLFFGGMTTLVNWITYAILTGTSTEFNKIFAESLAWFAAVIFAFFTNKFFVFEKKSTEKFLLEFIGFFGARALSGLVEVGGFALLVGVFKFNDWIVKIAISALVVLANYVLSKFLIFKK